MSKRNEMDTADWVMATIITFAFSFLIVSMCLGTANALNFSQPDKQSHALLGCSGSLLTRGAVQEAGGDDANLWGVAAVRRCRARHADDGFAARVECWRTVLTRHDNLTSPVPVPECRHDTEIIRPTCSTVAQQKCAIGRAHRTPRHEGYLRSTCVYAQCCDRQTGQTVRFS